MKSAVFAVLACFALAACNQEPAEPAPQASEAAPEAPAGIVVANGRLVLPPVKANPGAVYFDLANNGGADTAIASAFVDGAESAMLHSTTESGGTMSMEHVDSVPVAKGATVSFAPGGNHVMAMGLSDTLTPGTSAEVTLTFSNGDKVSFPAEVRAPGDGD
jgi:copper(I)-binding protein